MYSLPQEIEVWYIIPAIRREIAVCLSKDYKISYEKIGNMLGISKSAISQYIKKKRAAKIKLHEKAMQEIKKSCRTIAKNNIGAIKEIKRVLSIIRKEKLHCEVCGKIIGDELHDCKKITF